jgi:transglutaminase-like putative cysteine protease
MTDAEPHGFSRVMWLVVAMGMATAPFMELLPPWETLAIIILASWRLVVEHRGLVVVPILPVRLLLVAIVGLLLLITGNLGFGLTAATPLFVALLWSKLLELKARRDYLVACVLCYFLVAVLLFDRQSLFTCLYAIATLGAITIALVSYHLEVSSRGSFRMGMRLLLQGLPLAAAIFVLFPRLQVNFPNLSGQASSGFSDKLTPGDVARLALTDQPVMRVEFPDGDAPPPEQLYWRGLILSETDGATWNVVPRPLAYDRLPEPSNPQSRAITQHITLQPINQRWLFALDVAEKPPEQTRLALNRSLVRKFIPTQVLRYRVVSRLGDLPNDGEGVGRPLPRELDPRLRELAQAWRADGGDSLAIAERGLAWLRANDFTYSLAPGTMEAGAAEFLFEKRSGFCAHYATSFALVLRIAGVHSRVVVGFRGGDPNPFGDFLQITMQHAHAWCEVFNRGSWHRIDPTLGIPLAPGETQPAATRAAGGQAAAASTQGPPWMPAWFRGPYTRLNQWLAFVDAKWETDVMGMDGTRQDEWLSALGLKAYGGWILLGLVVVVLATVVIGFLWWSRIRPRVVVRDPQAAVWAQFCQRMARLGVERRSDEGPADFAARAAAGLPTLAEAINSIARDFIALRYGQPQDAAAGLVRLRQAIKALPRQAERAQLPAAGSSVPHGGS